MRSTNVRDAQLATGQSQRVTYAAARSAYAGRVTESPASFDTEGRKTSPRVRTRRRREVTFRTWARQEYKGRSAQELSPKLARVVHGVVS